MSQHRPQYPFPDRAVGSSFGAINRPNKVWTADDPLADQWQSVFYELFRGAGAGLYQARAKRLSAYGWTPNEFREACLHFSWHDWLTTPDIQNLSPCRTEAWAALIREVLTYHNAINRMARYRRLHLMDNLSRNGWTHTQIGEHLGITKRQVKKLLKEFAKTGDAL